MSSREVLRIAQASRIGEGCLLQADLLTIFIHFKHKKFNRFLVVFSIIKLFLRDEVLNVVSLFIISMVQVLVSICVG